MVQQAEVAPKEMDPSILTALKTLKRWHIRAGESVDAYFRDYWGWSARITELQGRARLIFTEHDKDYTNLKENGRRLEFQVAEDGRVEASVGWNDSENDGFINDLVLSIDLVKSVTRVQEGVGIHKDSHDDLGRHISTITLGTFFSFEQDSQFRSAHLSPERTA